MTDDPHQGEESSFLYDEKLGCHGDSVNEDVIYRHHESNTGIKDTETSSLNIILFLLQTQESVSSLPSAPTHHSFPPPVSSQAPP